MVTLTAHQVVSVIVLSYDRCSNRLLPYNPDGSIDENKHPRLPRSDDPPVGLIRP